MKFTLSWLKDHLDTTASLDEISKKLTAIGLEVESITDRSDSLKYFTVAKILDAQKHPEADKLRVCKMQSNSGELQIVCGAPNARAGIYVALAQEGTLIPGNSMVIKKTKIRNVESNGMLCSLEELGLPGDSAGIIELPGTPEIGSSVAALLGADDPIIEIAITPNRADCLGVYGIARDLAAAGIGTLNPLADTSAVNGSFPSPISVSITNAEKCTQFIGCYIKGVKNGESPDWLKKRLEAIGQRPISALVDISNYITYHFGRPLHVYDAKKLQGNLTVRDAVDGEKITALNGKEYILSTGITVIADSTSVLAIGGIIGGEKSGCTQDTTEAYLEVALFDSVHVAKNGRTLDILSDARFRFERGVDVAFVETGAKLALKMIAELCGGQCSELTCAGKMPDWKRTISFRPERVKTLGGVDIASEIIVSILKSLGFTSNWQLENGSYFVTPPSWRADVEGEADLVEEVLRIYGYDKIIAQSLPVPQKTSKAALNTSQKRVKNAKHTLITRGFLEAVTWSFLPEAQAAMFGGANPKLKLLNPINAQLDAMRPSLIPNLLDAAKRNAARGYHSVDLCEVGLQFHDITIDGQRMVAAGIKTALTTENIYKKGVFATSERAVDAFDAKAEALTLLQALGINKCDVSTTTPSWYHPGRSGALMLGSKNILGYFGEIHPAILKSFDIEVPVVAFEIFLDSIPTSRAKTKAKPALKISDFQAVERDFAFIVDEKIPAGDIIKSITSADKILITDVAIFDVYTGTGVEVGKKSVAVKVMLQAADRTLSEQDIITVSQAILAAAGKGFGGVLRQ
jgi:phenylalanyl-tRNA synthetase beta chain